MAIVGLKVPAHTGTELGTKVLADLKADMAAIEASNNDIQALVDGWGGRWFGTQAAAPAVDLNGGPVTAGDTYFDTVLDTPMIFTTGNGWIPFSTDGVAVSAAAAALADRLLADADVVQTGLDVVSAQAARDAAQLSSGIYADTAAGIAATIGGQYFSVPSAVAAEYLVLYRHDAGPVATSISTYPSASVILTSASQGLPTAASGTGTALGSSTRVNITPLGIGFLQNITAAVTTGTFTFLLLRKIGANTFNVQATLCTKALAAGVNTLDTADFGTVETTTDDYIALYSADGGAVWYDTAASGTSQLFAGLPAGDGVTMTNSGALLHLDCSYGSTVADDVAAVSSLAETNKDTLGLSPTIQGSALFFGSNEVYTDSVRVLETQITDVIVGIGLTFRSVGDGTCKIAILEYTGVPNVYESVYVETFTGLRAGDNMLTLAVPYSPSSHALVGFYSAAAGARLSYTSGSGGLNETGGDPTGRTLTLSAFAAIWHMQARVLTSDKLIAGVTTLGRRTAAVEAAVAGDLPFATISSKNAELFNQSLAASLPAGFEAAGAWTHDATGAISPITGSLTTYIQKASDDALDEFHTSSRIRIDDVTSIFAMTARGLGARGAYLEIDCAAGNLNASAVWDGVAAPTIVATQPIGFAITAGREYLCEMRKWIDRATTSRSAITLTITDTLTRSTASVTCYYDTSSGCSPAWGRKGVTFISGAIAVKSIRHATAMPRYALAGVYGDSRVEGAVLASTLDSRWHHLLAAALGGDVMVAGRGGDTAANTLARLPNDYGIFTQQFTFLELGTNDTAYVTWQSDMLAIIALIEGKGGIPVLTTLPPRTGIQAFLDLANAWIISSGYRYVDFAAALTLNNDRVTWNPAYNSGDSVHENAAGHAAEFAQLKIDVPELFD